MQLTVVEAENFLELSALAGGSVLASVERLAVESPTAPRSARQR